MRFELTTSALPRQRSTIEAIPALKTISILSQLVS